MTDLESAPGEAFQERIAMDFLKRLPITGMKGDLKWAWEAETGRTVFGIGKKVFYCDPGEPTPATIAIAEAWFRLHERD